MRELNVDSLQEFLDRQAILQAIQEWTFFRDDGRWTELRELFAPDGRMTSSVSSGSAESFIEFSKALVAKGKIQAQHFMGPAIIKLNGDKAHVESRVMILLRGVVKGVEVDVTAHLRMLDRLRRIEDRWRIELRSPIYIKDRMDVVTPGASLHVDADEVAHYSPGYRFMAFLSDANGSDASSQRLPTLGTPEADAMYGAAYEWLQR